MKLNTNPKGIIEKMKAAWLKRPVLTTALFFIFLLIFWGIMSLPGSEGDIDASALYTVKTGPLRISISETGAVQPKEKLVLKNEVEGQTTIVYIVDEGAKVEAGDLLMELDSSTLTDNKVDMEITVLSAEASYIDARENLSVIESQSQTNVDQAELDYEFAKQDLEKYIKGEYPNQLKEAEATITLAEEEMAEAQETVEWSKKLYEDQFISASELESDELAYKKKNLDLELAKRDLELLVNYTHKRQLAKLKSDVKQAEMALDRTRRKATANVVQAEASLKAKEAEYARQKSKLEKIEAQLGKTKIYSPVDAQVIYATSVSQGSGPMRFRRQEPLDLGVSITERQELFHLPVEEGYIIETSIPEASIDKVQLGLPVLITVDAIPGAVFSGKVDWVSPMVDAQTSYMNSDLKVYETKISLDESENLSLLRADMECNIEIVLAQFDKTTYVPIEAILSVGGEPTVYVVDGNDLEPRTVAIGLDNGIVIQIDDGLNTGEIVTLAPPLDAGIVSEDVYEQFAI
jgi:HlyD family secretion protein